MFSASAMRRIISTRSSAENTGDFAVLFRTLT